MKWPQRNLQFHGLNSICLRSSDRTQRQQRLSHSLATLTFGSLQAFQLHGVIPEVQGIQAVQLPRVEGVALLLLLAHFEARTIPSHGSLTSDTGHGCRRTSPSASERAWRPQRAEADWLGVVNRAVITGRPQQSNFNLISFDYSPIADEINKCYLGADVTRNCTKSQMCSVAGGGPVKVLRLAIGDQSTFWHGYVLGQINFAMRVILSFGLILASLLAHLKLRSIK